MIRIVLIPAVNYMQHSGKNNCSKCTVKGEARSAPFGSVNATHKEQRTSGKSLARRHWRFLCGRKELVLPKKPKEIRKARRDVAFRVARVQTSFPQGSDPATPFYPLTKDLRLDFPFLFTGRLEPWESSLSRDLQIHQMPRSELPSAPVLIGEAT